MKIYKKFSKLKKLSTSTGASLSTGYLILF